MKIQCATCESIQEFEGWSTPYNAFVFIASLIMIPLFFPFSVILWIFIYTANRPKCRRCGSKRVIRLE